MNCINNYVIGVIALKNRKKKAVLFIILALMIALASYFFYFKDKLNQNTTPNGDEWSTPIGTEPSLDFDSLYSLGEVPTLDKLLINSTFVKQVTINRVPYLHGFSTDGRFAAFINYTEKDGEAFIVQIYDTFSTEIVYTTYIPNTEDILESKELAVAQQAVSEGFAIEIMPDKIKFDNNMKYDTLDGTFSFEFEVDRDIDSSYLKIAKEDSKDRWIILADNGLKYKKSNVQMFTYPDNPNFVVFVINNSPLNGQNYTPVFINISDLTYRNSEKGRVEEADNWLYGNFEFVYNQWNVNEQYGFIAFSADNKNIRNQKYSDFVEQWIYLDSSGRMRWYGNAKGIFNFEAKPVNQTEGAFYYRIRIMEGINKNKAQSFIVDQYDMNTNLLLRTFEFMWNDENQTMESIQIMDD